MRLLDRYLLRELLIPLGYCLGGFLIFWVSFDLFSEVGDFQSRNLTVLDVAEFYLIKTPEMLSVVLPVALLLAVLYALTNHARHHELTAMRAAGISLWRLSMPYMGVGLLFSLALLAVSELWVPASFEKAERILTRRDSSAQANQDWKQDLFFRNQADGRDWHASAYNLQSLTLSNVNIQWRMPDGAWRDVYAASAQWTNNAWVFHEVQEWRYKSPEDVLPTPIMTNLLVFPEFSETPALIRSELKINSLSSIQAAKRPQLSIEEIRNYFRLHPVLPPKQFALLDTQLHGRLAAPWTCLVVVLIAIPFGAPSGRRNVFVGVAASIFLCFAYFILLRLGLSLGTGGHLPGWLAAWLPNLVFAAAGIALTLRVR